MNIALRKFSDPIRSPANLGIALVCGIITTFGYAQSTYGDGGSAFTAFFGMSDSPKFIRDLMQSGGNDLRLPKKNAYLRDDVISGVFIAKNFQWDAEGHVNVSAGFEWIRPDGSIVFSEKSYSIARGKPTASTTWGILDPVLELGFDDRDAPGAHLLRISVTDHVSGKTVSFQEPLMLVTNARRKGVLNRPIDRAKVLEQLWADYMEHRDDLPIRRIVSVLHWAEEGSGMAIVLGGAARWSLASQMQQNPEVLRICEKLILVESGTTRTILEKLVDEAKTGAALEPL